eukprot:393075_1
MSDGFSRGKVSVTKTTLQLLDDINLLLDAVSTFMGELQTLIFVQITGIRSVVQTVTPRLSAGTTRIIDKMHEIEIKNDNVTIYSGGFAFKCEFCDTVSQRMVTLSNQISGKTDAQFAEFNVTIKDTDVTFVTVEGDIRQTLGDVAIQLSDVRIAIDESGEPLRELMPDIRDFEDKRRFAFNCVFAIPLISFVAVVIGAILRMGIIFKINYLLGFLTLFIMWALYSVHAPVAVMAADTCYLFDEVEQENWALLGTISGPKSQDFIAGRL